MIYPKVALVSLRGVEGCGISAWERQFNAYYKQVGGVCDMYALNDRVGRPETSVDLDVKMFGSLDFKDVLDKINSTYDLVMIMGVPSKKSKHAHTYVPNFLAKIKIRKVMVNHDHHYQSINRNADFKSALEISDVVCAHSLDPSAKSGFKNWAEKKDIKINRWGKLYTFIHPPLYKDLINTSHSTRKKRLTNFGRAVLWKRNLLLFNIANKLAKRGFIAQMLGFERSIAGWCQMELYIDELNIFGTKAISKLVSDRCFFKDFDTMSTFQRVEHNNLLVEFIRDELPYQPSEYFYSIGSLDHYIGLREIAESAFAGHFRSFEHTKLDYGNNHEYQGLEAMLLSVPIFHRHFLETCTLPFTDISLSSLDCFVSIDDDNRHMKHGGFQVLNPDEFIDKLEAIWSNPKLYQQMRSQNLEIIHDHYSCEKLVPKFLEEIV